MDLEYLERWSERGKAVYAREVTRLLKSFGTSFNEPPHYLQVSIRRISLTDQATQKEGGGASPVTQIQPESTTPMSLGDSLAA